MVCVYLLTVKVGAKVGVTVLFLFLVLVPKHSSIDIIRCSDDDTNDILSATELGFTPLSITITVLCHRLN